MIVRVVAVAPGGVWHVLAAERDGYPGRETVCGRWWPTAGQVEEAEEVELDHPRVCGACRRIEEGAR